MLRTRRIYTLSGQIDCFLVSGLTLKKRVSIGRMHKLPSAKREATLTVISYVLMRLLTGYPPPPKRTKTGIRVSTSPGLMWMRVSVYSAEFQGVKPLRPPRDMSPNIYSKTVHSQNGLHTGGGFVTRTGGLKSRGYVQNYLKRS